MADYIYCRHKCEIEGELVVQGNSVINSTIIENNLRVDGDSRLTDVYISGNLYIVRDLTKMSCQEIKITELDTTFKFSGTSLSYDTSGYFLSFQEGFQSDNVVSLDPYTIIKVGGQFFQVKSHYHGQLGEDIRIFGKIKKDFYNESLESIYSNLTIPDKTQLLEFSGDANLRFSNLQIPLFLPLASENKALCLKIFNRTYGDSYFGVQIKCSRDDTINREGNQIEMIERVDDTETSWSVTLLSNGIDTWYIL